MHARFTVQETVTNTVARGHRYLPHGGLGLLIIVSWAYLYNSRKASAKQKDEDEQARLRRAKVDWLKSRTVLSMSAPQEQRQKPDSAEFPESLAQDEGASSVVEKEDYDGFLRDSKATKVMAPSEVFSPEEES